MYDTLYKANIIVSYKIVNALGKYVKVSKPEPCAAIYDNN